MTFIPERSNTDMPLCPIHQYSQILFTVPTVTSVFLSGDTIFQDFSTLRACAAEAIIRSIATRANLIFFIMVSKLLKLYTTVMTGH